MRVSALAIAFAGALLSLHAEDTTDPPEKLKSQIGKFIDAANSGDWSTVAAQSNLPSCYGYTICKTGVEIKERIRSNSEGVSRTLTKTEIVKNSTVRPLLPDEARKFVADGDTLVRIRYDERSKGKTDSNRCLLIFRPVRGDLLLAGAITDPMPEEKK